MNQGMKGKEPTIKQQIIELLRFRGKMTAVSMSRYIPYHYKIIYNKALELRAEGLVDRNAESMWFLKVEPVDPSNTRIPQTTAPEQVQEYNLVDIPSEPSRGQLGEFMQQFINMGVDPGIALTIADIFFSKHIYDIQWLDSVLKEAEAWVTPGQRRLMVGYWAATRGLRDQLEFLDDW